jgi:hypothetical protein
MPTGRKFGCGCVPLNCALGGIDMFISLQQIQKREG